MPQMKMIINPKVVDALPNLTAIEWARKEGFEDVRLPVEEVLDEPGQVAVFPRFDESMEPESKLLGVEFNLHTGRYYAEEKSALYDALIIYRALSDKNAKWVLPKSWGFWFHCKGQFDDIWLDPMGFMTKHERLVRISGCTPLF